MGHCHHHALSSVKKWGGVVEDYLPLHQWFDESKAITTDFRHRALRHHAEGIFMRERFFGATITVSTGRGVGEMECGKVRGYLMSDFKGRRIQRRLLLDRRAADRRPADITSEC